MSTFKFSKEVLFGNMPVGNGHPSYIIAEIGANFDNDLDKAKRLCDAAKEAGADCAKFQSFISEKIVSAKGFSMMQLNGVHGSWGRPVNEVFKDAEFPREWHQKVADHCKNIGIHFSSSPYDFEAVDLCVSLDVPYIKIGSGEITWLEMIEYISKTGKPLILATGDATLSEVDEAIRTIESTGNNQLVLLQCITNYPSKIESGNVRVVKSYQDTFDVLSGCSDHAPTDIIPIASTVLGGCVIEKHFTINKADKGPDHPHSMDVKEFKAMVQNIRNVEAALGSSRKNVVEEEAETVYVQRRGLYSRKAIPKGKIIEASDLVELRPALGILPKYKNSLVGLTAKNDIEEGIPVKWEMF